MKVYAYLPTKIELPEAVQWNANGQVVILCVELADGRTVQLEVDNAGAFACEGGEISQLLWAIGIRLGSEPCCNNSLRPIVPLAITNLEPVIVGALMGTIYKCKVNKDEERVLEALRKKVRDGGAGVTLTGNRLTVHWSMEGYLVDAHMIIERVTTPEDRRINSERDDRMREVYNSDPDLEAELYRIEFGEYPQ